MEDKRRVYSAEELNKIVMNEPISSDEEEFIYVPGIDDVDIESTSGSTMQPIFSHKLAVMPPGHLAEEEEIHESDEEDIHELEETFSHPKWSSRKMRLYKHNFDESDSGCKADVNQDDNVLAFFLIFFTEQLITFITEESNKYLDFMLSQGVTARSRLKNQEPITTEEMFCFLAITMLMARVKKLSLAEYWSKDKLIETPIFSEIFSRDRYLLILRSLHFTDNNGPKTNDRLQKVRGVVDRLRESFRTNLVPYQNLCIDESLLLFKGNLFFKQYVPSKRSRFGIKTFVLCDCKTGYVLDFIVYTGSESDILHSDQNIGKSGDIVSTLMQPYIKKGHTLFVDNWYTSPTLFLWLSRNETNACGTARKTRKEMPKMAERLKKGEMSFRTSERLLAMKWCDKREVWFLSTYHKPNMETVERRRSRTPEAPAMKPSAIVEYNKNMGAVDQTDMLLSSIESVRKTIKWYKKCFFHMMDVSILNAHSLHKLVTKQNLSIANFQLTLVRELLSKYSVPRRQGAGRKSDEDHPLRHVNQHYPDDIPNNTKRANAFKRCKLCFSKNVRKETKYMCKVCKVPLCVVPCFEQYHTK